MLRLLINFLLKITALKKRLMLLDKKKKRYQEITKNTEIIKKSIMNENV